MFYADADGNAGTDLTFFAFPGITKNRAGAGEIDMSVLRVATNNSIE